MRSEAETSGWPLPERDRHAQASWPTAHGSRSSCCSQKLQPLLQSAFRHALTVADLNASMYLVLGC